MSQTTTIKNLYEFGNNAMFKYGLRLRPVGIGCQPKGFIKFEDSDKYKTGYWSFIWYESKLSDKELYDYEMDFIQEE